MDQVLELPPNPWTRSRGVVATAILALLAGCAAKDPFASDDAAAGGSIIPVGHVDAHADTPLLTVPASRLWTDTGIDLGIRECVTITATGRIITHERSRWRPEIPSQVGPEGTYLFGQDVMEFDFPMPAAGHGPAPCYCLIGRIGEGPPFYVGTSTSWVVDQPGRLFLGVNDFNVDDNSGAFQVEVARESGVRPVAHVTSTRRVLSSGGGQPADGCSVVVFYVDGLRPDVVQEMAAMGHLPNIRQHFIENGAWLKNTFTAFPSDTITSNGTMWTGCYSDRHGLKEQVRFSRRKLASQSYLSAAGPHRSSQLLAPQGIDRLTHQAQAVGRELLYGEEGRDEWLGQETSAVPPLYEILRQHGANWATGVLPIMSEMPPALWTRSLMQHMPYLQTHRVWEYIDDANAHYALHQLLDERQPVTIIWLPETDSCSHKCSRGQFGVTRRTIVQADRLLGEIVTALESQNRLSSTYLMLVSDHGHIGGRTSHLSHYDLAQEFFHAPRQVNAAGDWIGGGLGLSVRQDRFENRHRGDPWRRFVFIDGEADGAARIFLPRGSYDSSDWSGPNRPGDLLRYRIAEGRDPIDLVHSLVAAEAVHGDGTLESPVDLVLLKLDDQRILITTGDRGSAVIHRQEVVDRRWTYKYTVVTDIRPESDGGVSYRAVRGPGRDPLGLLNVVDPEFLDSAHDEITWLNVTARTDYPDGVVSLTRHLLWDSSLRPREQEYAPDLVVTAKDRWYFGRTPTPGTTHGHPLYEAARATWFVSGPNIVAGSELRAPARLVDLTPTILDMIGIRDRFDEFDGRPIRGFYRSDVQLVSHQPEIVLWHDRDLGAWTALPYTALLTFDRGPLSMNHPEQPWDLTNIAYNVVTLSDWSVLRLMDDVISPLTGPAAHVSGTIARAEASIRSQQPRWIADGPGVFNLTGLAVGDYSFTSQGNIHRVDRAIDYLQLRGKDLERTLATPLDRATIPGSAQLHGTVDFAQASFWEVYRFGQRLVVVIVDETLINGIEDRIDRVLNLHRRTPAEITVTREP